MPDDPQPPNVVKFVPGIWCILAGCVIGFMLGFLVMRCLILLGAV